MERMAMEANMNMLTQMLSVCKEKTMKRSHTSKQLSDAEKQAFSNCLSKFADCPNVVMMEMQAMGQQQGGF